MDPAKYDFATYQIVKSANTNWFNETYSPVPTKNIQASASSRSDLGTYAVGLSYFDQKNTADTYSYYKRYTLRANTSLNIRKFLKFGENLQVSYNKTRPIGNNPGSAWVMPSIVPVYDIIVNP
jgi:TonB-dependent starch-binding outer membrane protein SusC